MAFSALLLKLIVLILSIIVTKQRIQPPIEEISKELTQRLMTQHFRNSYRLTIKDKFALVLHNVVPIFFFKAPYYTNNDYDIHFDDTLVTFYFDIHITHLHQPTDEVLYVIPNQFAENKYDITFTHHRDNSYDLFYSEKPNAFSLSQSILQTLPQFKNELMITPRNEVKKKLNLNLEHFIDKQLITYPMDDCLFRFNVLLDLVRNKNRYIDVVIPLSDTQTITFIRFSFIDYSSSDRELFGICKLNWVQIIIDYYNALDIGATSLININSIYLSLSKVTLEKVDPSIPLWLVRYVTERFELYAKEAFGAG